MRDAILDTGVDVVSHPSADLNSRMGMRLPEQQPHFETCCVPVVETKMQSRDGQMQEDLRKPDNLPSCPPTTLKRPIHVHTPQITFDSQSTLLDVKGSPAVPNNGPYRVTLSVGGMTCSACSTAVTNTLSELPGVTGVSVSLISNSAALIIDDKKRSDSIIGAVEDCGFEVQIVKTEPLCPLPGGQSQEPNRRTIHLRVDGMFSQYVGPTITSRDIHQFGVARHCAEQVMASLDGFGAAITVDKPLADYLDPILQLSYMPAPPTITIRTIMSTIASSRSPPLTVSIHENATLEDVARNMRMKEQTKMLRRLVFTIIIAIPSFVLAIVYGSLVKKDNASRKYLLEPMWTGNTSRLEWALLFLATPVMFYSANVFHQRCIKEIRALWKRGSRATLLRRFTRFGSMSMLVRVTFPATASNISTSCL